MNFDGLAITRFEIQICDPHFFFDYVLFSETYKS